MLLDLFLLFAALVCVGWLLIEAYAFYLGKQRARQEIQAIAHCDDALILGSAKRLANGTFNRYYRYRIEAAWDLWRAGRVSRLIVSGDGLYGSETADMQADLIAAGIPASAIWQDEGGLRTLDSIARYRATFGNKRQVCIVSQPFHNRRALVLAQRYRLDAQAYDAEAVGMRHNPRLWLRERAARLRLLWDICAHTQARQSIENVPIRQIAPENVQQ